LDLGPRTVAPTATLVQRLDTPRTMGIYSMYYCFAAAMLMYTPALIIVTIMSLICADIHVEVQEIWSDSDTTQIITWRTMTWRAVTWSMTTTLSENSNGTANSKCTVPNRTFTC
jgi:hypothetical protein